MIARTVPPAYAPVSPAALFARSDLAPGTLEARLRDRFAADRAVLTGSGTEALRLAVRAALRLAARRGRPDGAVAIPAFTCYDVASAVLAEASRVACFDLDPERLAPEPGSLANVLEAGATVVVVSPLYGQPVPWEPLATAAAAAGAVLIEDAAQGHGASWRGRPLGSLGEISVVSFARGKGWTGGGGGALLARGEAAEELPLPSGAPKPSGSAGLRILGGAFAQWALGRPAFYGIPASLPGVGLGTTTYRPASEPRPMAPQSERLAVASEAAADEEAAERRRRGGWLRERLGSGSVPPVAVGGVAGELRLPVRAPGLAARLDADAARRGIARTYPEPICALDPVSRVLEGSGPWPGAESLARDLVTAPTHSLLQPVDAERVLRWFDTVAGKPRGDGGGGAPRGDVPAGTSVAAGRRT